MRRVTFLLLFLATLVPGHLASGDTGSDTFLPKDLSGWEGLLDYWKWDGQALVGSSPKGLKFNTFLCSKKKIGDFELQFQVQLKEGKGNSGVQIRSEVMERKNFAVKGPQCDIGGGFWGSLYGEHFGGMMQAAPGAVVKKALKATDFNEYYIKCVGKHVTIKLNGEVTVNGDFPKMPDEGIIAWQLHAGGPMEVTFRNIRFKDLSKK